MATLFKHCSLRLSTAWLALLLAACGNGGGSEPDETGMPDPPGPSSAVTVTSPEGSSVAVPTGGLAGPTSMALDIAPAGFPSLPAGTQRASEVYAITPHGTRFRGTARVRLRYDPSLIAPGDEPVIWKADPGGVWQVHEATPAPGGYLEADVPSLSYFLVAARPFRAPFGSPTPSVTVSYETPEANSWSSQADPQLGLVSTLPRPSDVVLRTQLLNAPLCTSGWQVSYQLVGWQYEERPAASGLFSLFSDASSPVLNPNTSSATLGSNAWQTTVPWDSLSPVNNRVDELQVQRVLAATVSSSISPNGSTYVGYVSVQTGATSGVPNDPGIQFLSWLSVILGNQRATAPRSTPPTPPRSVWIDRSRVLSQVALLLGPTIHCNGTPFPVGIAGITRTLFVATGDSRLGIRRQPESASRRDGQVATFSVELIGAGAGAVPVTVDWYRAAPGSALFEYVGRSDTQVTQGALYSHSQPVTRSDDGSLWRAVACAAPPLGTRSDCIETRPAVLTVTP